MQIIKYFHKNKITVTNIRGYEALNTGTFPWNLERGRLWASERKVYKNF